MTLLERPDGLPGDDPQAYLAEDRRRALSAGSDLALRTRGAALFADVSGFTVLTEALVAELGARGGAEELSTTLERVFGAVLTAVQDWGGSTVYFSGDAVTCWFDGDDGAHAVACALEVREAVARTGLVRTPGGREVQLGVKVAVAVGPAVRFVVGDPALQRIDVLAGALMDLLAAAEQQAVAGEVLLDATAVAALGDRVELGAPRADGVVVLEALREPPPHPRVGPPPVLADALARPWLLPAVRTRLGSGRGEFLAELRPAVPVFIRFGGLDLEHDPQAPAALDAFVTRAQQIVDAAGGNVLQLTLGDKGAYLYAAFGAPRAHEDDAARACAAALELLALDGTVQGVRDVQVGIASGRVRSGTYGSAQRRTYCCLGAPVNLSARLMSAAAPGTVLVSAAVAQAAGDDWEFEERTPLKAKGIAAPVAVRALRGLRAGRAVARAAAPLQGRAAELAALRARTDRARGGSGSAVLVLAEAGAGKSRLVAEVAVQARAAGDRVLHAEVRSSDRLSAYPGWKDLWSELLGLDPDQPQASLERAVAAVDPALLPRTPLLGALLGVALPDSELTARFDAGLRRTSLEDLLVRLLQAAVRDAPLVVLLENAHWLDPLGRDLLAALARTAATSRLLLLLTARPPDDGDTDVSAVPGLERTTLGPLDRPAAEALLRTRLRRLGHEEVEPALVALLAERGEGNPFYLEQLVDFLLDELDGGAALPTAREVAVRDVPQSLASLVLSRLDRLQEGPRRTAKVASVVGRSFAAPVLVGAYPELGADEDVRGHLASLVADRLVEPELDPEFQFGHLVTREVAYESLPGSLRLLLHRRVGTHLEAVHAEDPERVLGLLAHHFGLSDDLPRKRTYLVRAGEAAQRAYANAAAVDLLGRAAPLLPEPERGPVLLRLGAVLELSGEWARAETVYSEALELVVRLGSSPGRARTALAEVARKQGRFAAAGPLLVQAARELADDDEGLARVLHLQGTLASQQGSYAQAREAYGRSLELRRGLGDEVGAAALLSNLALVAENEGDLARAQELGEQALALRAGLGDRWGSGVSQMNLGMLALLREEPEQAQPRFEEALARAEEVGDPWLVVVAHHNLANTARLLGDGAAAGAQFAATLAGYLAQGDRWSLTMLLEDLALLVLAQQEPQDGLLLLGAADALREELGTPRPPAVQEQLAGPVAAAALTLGEAAVAQVRARGSAQGADGVLDLARRCCGA